MKLLIGGKNRNIYKRKDGSAYYKSGGQQVDVTHMFKKNGGGLKKKYIKGGMTEEEFKSLQEKCIKLNDKLKKLYGELESHTFSKESSYGFIRYIFAAYYENSESLHKLANEIYKDITKVNASRGIDKYQPVITNLTSFIYLLTDKNDETNPQKKIKEYLDVMYTVRKASDKTKFDTTKRHLLNKLRIIIKTIEQVTSFETSEDLTIDYEIEEAVPQEDQDGIKGIKFDSIKINSKETNKKKALKQICCLALYGLAAGMTDELKVNVETGENKDNKDKIKVLNKIKNTKDFINHLKQSYDTLSIDENSTPDQINREIKQFGFVNYNEDDGVFVTRAYILNKILQCFEDKDYIASNKKSIVKSKGKLLLNGRKKLIDPKTGIMESIDIEDLTQLFTNIHTIVKLTNDAEIAISFHNLHYVLFFEEDIGSSQTVTEKAHPVRPSTADSELDDIHDSNAP